MAPLAANADLKIGAPILQPMQSSLIKSGLFHIGIIVVFTVGLPFVKKPDDMILSAPISVEIVNVSEMTTTTKVAPPQKPKEEEKAPEPPKKVEAPPQVKSEKPPDLSKPVPPDVKPTEDLPEPAPAKPIERTPVKKPEPPKPKPETTKTAEPKPKEDDFQSLLRNIIPDDKKASEGEEPAKKAEPETGQIAKLADTLSISEQDALRRQLAGCWNVMAGAKYAEELIVEIRVEMNRDRTINRASILDTGRYNRDTHFRAAADAAVRALRNPKCSPLMLPPEKYDQWKTVLIRFDPRDML